MPAKVIVYMILFFLVANPATFKLMRQFLGSWVATAEGLPSAPGLLLHSAVYVLLACYIPAKLVSSFADTYEEKYGEEKYIGEYGATMNPFGLSSAKRNQSSSLY